MVEMVVSISIVPSIQEKKNGVSKMKRLPACHK
jgi:hypothetical protein